MPELEGGERDRHTRALERSAIARRGARARQTVRLSEDALELSGVLARSGSRPRHTVAASLRSLVRCRVGPYPLVIDLRELSGVGVGGEEAAEGALRLDLRQVFGASAEGPGELLSLRGLQQAVELVVDPGAELCAVELEGLQPFPDLLHRRPLLRALCGVIPLDGELHYLLDPGTLLEEAAPR